MVITLVIFAAYLGIASLIAVNSVLEAERDRLTAKDILVVALVCAFWPLVACVLLLAQGRRKLGLGQRQCLPTMR
ncbi:conserved hypothetical protein [Bosea sp. 62]|uniref:hypothetical protein n=1 Tax=unclassified Bosea (in: a-proteobacteria) TaxID=2653178 RepID=UPI001259BD8F|nr:MULTISPECIES: hypothetical protein [unclassified Bosea (in: a-proteobacteria)]CAD5256768.1 conserved hypothetical protein [Bosea sp. 46]CAD5261162.1 conserved hypothetical protein [Bosea sp. 21B]CAD5279479.1 conserved hypothetical protein [Bosea sp. 7B]VVT58409.1 conserved hypothetical protein [Bosea sp. EC-HK365B]VXB53415.1 conserved hypothetical protein [Bosea sp. 29B]